MNMQMKNTRISDPWDLYHSPAQLDANLKELSRLGQERDQLLAAQHKLFAAQREQRKKGRVPQKLHYEDLSEAVRIKVDVKDASNRKDGASNHKSNSRKHPNQKQSNTDCDFRGWCTRAVAVLKEDPSLISTPLYKSGRCIGLGLSLRSKLCRHAIQAEHRDYRQATYCWRGGHHVQQLLG
ncbi:hypothetical protein MMC10_007893 [Thelotrema lepadinum]|nr:hypothetical protein [Thelotrema lepadinum]